MFIRKILKQLAKKNPLLEKIVIKLYFRYTIIKVGNIYLPQIFKTFWINPSDIEYAVTGNLDRMGDVGQVKGGEWDKKILKFEEWDVFKSMKDRILNKKTWQETEYYQRVIQDILHKRREYIRFKTPNQFIEHCNYWDSLFKEIKLNGYKTQAELSSPERFQIGTEDEIAVRINRYGHPLVESGNHRLAIAKILNIKAVPIKVTARHEKWVNLRKEILQFKSSRSIYQPLTHFDLQDIVSDEQKQENVFHIIQQIFPIPNKARVIDIGANLGYYCHKLEDLGYSCTAIENHPFNLNFLEKLKVAEKKNFNIINKSVFELPQEKVAAEIIIALNIFHHFLKTKELFNSFEKLLHIMKSEILIFEPYAFSKNDQAQMQNSYVKFSPDEFVEFIKRNSIYKYSKDIGYDNDLNRPVFLLSSNKEYVNVINLAD